MYLNRKTALQILGLNEDEDEINADTIASAYRKRAKDVHPDKTKVTDNDEFIRLRAAYDYLLSDDDDHASTTNHDMLFKTMLNLIRSMIISAFNASNPHNTTSNEYNCRGVDKNNDIHVTIDVTIQELYLEHGKKVTVRYKSKDIGQQTHEILVPFIDYKNDMFYEGKGDWDPCNEKYGDLHLKLIVQDDDTYMINTYVNKLDLIRTFDISIYDYYVGFCLEMDHFGETLMLHYHPYLQGKDTMLLGKGLKGRYVNGDLYILFNLDMSNCKENITEHAPTLRLLFPSMMNYA
jgi:DnaJ-class molecular chaperone